MAHLLDRCGTLPPTDRDVHAAGGAFRHADARGLFTAGRSSYYNGVSSRSMRHPSPTDRDFHAAGGVLRHADARGGFRPANAARTPPHFSPHATYRRLISSYKFLLSPSLFPVAAPIGPPLRAVGHRPAGTGAVCSSFLSAPRRRDSNGPFFHLQVLPVLAAPPAPLQASSPWRCPVRRSAAVPPRPPPRSPRNPDCAAVCPHPFTPFIPPIARAPRL